MLRVALESDISQIAAIHMNVLPSDLLPRLGRRFLETCFYPALLKSSHGFVVVDEEAGDVHGFCVFSYDSDALSRDAMGRKLAVFSTLLMKVLRHPGIALELVSSQRTKVVFSGTRKFAVGRLPEIYLLGVRAGVQGRGLGSQMISYGVERLKKASGVCLARTSKEDARSFYLKNGFSQIGLETRGKKTLFVLAREWRKSTRLTESLPKST